jgi:aldehyde:ferredoxin oxidoreductase
VAARSLAWSNIYNALVLCRFQTPGAARVARALGAVTGWDCSADDLMTIGKDIVTLKRHLNQLRGLNGAGDRLPAVLLNPLSDGGTEKHVPDVAALLAGAYAELGWDPQTAGPTPENLRALGIVEGPI